MYGTNSVSAARDIAEGFLVKEIFYTLQGEGPAAGLPAVFVRFAGCNLRCTFCDTDFDDGEHMDVITLVKRIRQLIPPFSNYRIVLTGGEPMLQPLPVLITHLNAIGINGKVDIETAGTVWPTGMTKVAPHVRIVCSPKTPSVNNWVAEAAYAWKYILRAGEVSQIDGLPHMATQDALRILGKHNIYRPDFDTILREQVYVQACDDGDAEQNQRNLTAAAQSAMQHGYRLSVQMHKLANLP